VEDWEVEENTNADVLEEKTKITYDHLNMQMHK
jgi:hypothetical protein